MKKDKQEIPPAVAEFVAGERPQLLEKIEQQAREIERLNKSAGNWGKWCAQAVKELSALKAQPGGVVPSLSAAEREDLMEFHEAVCCDASHRVEKAGMKRLAEIGAVESVGFGKHRLTEFGVYLLGLNQQPASGGVIVPEEFICDSKPLQDLLNATALLLETPCQDSATYWAAMLANVEALLKPISAGGVDERAALQEAATSLETIADLAGRDDFMIDLADVRSYASSRASVARAALSANHSEQGRGWWQLVPVEPTPEMLEAVTTSKHGALRAEVMRMAATDYRLMLAAAPSAGQKEQGE